MRYYTAEEKREYYKQYRLKNKERISARSKIRAKEYNATHRAEKNKLQRDYCKRNKEKVRLSKQKYYQENKEKIYEHQKQYNETHKERRVGEAKRYYHKHREEEGYRGLRNLYSITKEQYDEMFMKQNGCCAICGIHHTSLTKKLYVDHDHDTKELRGLLCNKCNLGLGLFRDDVSLLQKATDYLSKFACGKEITCSDQLPDSPAEPESSTR
jgi:hypothetical protein